MMRAFLVGGIALLPLTPSAGGPSEAASRISPPGRAHHVLFYDEARQRVVVSGGGANDARRNSTILTDLWSFDGAAWTALPSSTESVMGARVDIDGRMRAYAFGGFAESPSGDLRVLENDRWRKVGVHPSIAAVEPGFVFDAARNRFVTFGGQSASRRMNRDVWEFDGVRWSRNAAPPPPARGAHAMVYDPARRKIVLFGGMGDRVGERDTPILADTWEFDGSAWTQMRVGGPPARLGAGIAYDSKRALVILFGGSNHGGVLNDLWSWDGRAWRKLSEGGPAPRVMGYIAYDKRRDRIVLFGGRLGVPLNTDLADTWEWDGASWREIP